MKRKEGIIMLFLVCDDNDRVIYDGGSWPMARAALDSLVMKDKGCPRLHCWAEPETEKEP